MNEVAEESLRVAFADQPGAMKQGDTVRLSSLLGDGFTLKHITGYFQPKSEWLAQMRAGLFRYHDIRQQGTKVAINGDSAAVTGRIITDATVYGTRADWRLQLAVEFLRRGYGWLALRSTAKTW